MKSPFVRRNEGWVCVDICLSREIAELWHLGINTVESCCGHNKRLGYIAVSGEDISKMEGLGYERELEERKDIFIPKYNY